ncbi:MAG: hypothetical protein NTU53_03830 [Planctomycetota bacterium]|nr:hypothetical protein [Planctomycetota bacterium]
MRVERLLSAEGTIILEILLHISKEEQKTRLAAVRVSVRRGRPYADDDWTRKTPGRLALPSTLRPVGRPKKAKREE